MSKVLITGGSGFVGSRLVKTLSAGGDPVAYTYRRAPITGVNAEGLELDLARGESFDAHSASLQDVTHLVHAAAQPTHNREDILQDLDDQIRVPVEGFRNLMQRLPNLQRIIFVSSCSAALADRDPAFYGSGKLLMEGVVSRVAEAQNMPYATLRFPQLYGPGEPHGIFITKFLEALEAGATIRLINAGAVQKDVLYIDDAVGSIAQALSAKATGLFTITDSQPSTVRQILEALVKVTGKQPCIENIQADQAEIDGKSFHFESTATTLGYRLQYSLNEGIEALVRAVEGEEDV